MATIDIFSRIELSQKEVFKHFLEPSIFTRNVSPFFTIANFTSAGPVIDTNTYFSLKSVLFDLLQFFVTVKEIVPDKKIVFDFNGLIKGTQTLYFIDDAENGTLLREKFEFALYNQFNLPILSLILSIFFYIDTCIKHFRLKNLLYKDLRAQGKNNLKDLFVIRSCIVVEADMNEIDSLLQDLNKFALLASPFLKIETHLKNQEIKEGQEFLVTLAFPILPRFNCRITRKKANKIEVSFSNPILNGRNVWSILPCEKEIIIENAIEIDEASAYLKLIWLLLGNSLVKIELSTWNKRLKDIAEKTNLYKDVFQNNLSSYSASF